MFSFDFSSSLLLLMGLLAIGVMFLGLAFRLVGHYRIGQSFLIIACLLASVGFFQHAIYVGRDVSKHVIHVLDQCTTP